MTVNAGSSSIKLDIFTSYQRLYTLHIVGLGQSAIRIRVTEPDKETVDTTIQIDSDQSIEQQLYETLEQSGYLQDVGAISHRIVQAGPRSQQAETITDDLVRELETYMPLDPGHLGRSLRLIDLFRQNLPDALHIACFDTAYFYDLPRVAQLLSVPNQDADPAFRRYGFHGLSYAYLQQTFQEYAGDVAVNGRVIYAHLGSGASLAATRSGKPVDTTMGFSPASGIVMSTRSGDIDPSLAWYMHTKYDFDEESFKHMINFESGLLGVSGRSADMNRLLQEQDQYAGSRDAVALFVYNVQKAIGSLAATIGGVDSLIFSGGIGEQSSEIRQRVCQNLDFLGITIDSRLNGMHEKCISSDSSRVGVHVIPTDESIVMCRLAREIIGQKEALR